MQMSSSSASSHTEEDGGTDTDDDFMVVFLALQSIDGHDGSGTNKNTRSLPLETGIQWVERQLLDSDDCYDMFRMRRTVFRMLHETLVNEYGLTSTREVSSKEALGMFLWMCDAPQSFRQAKNKFHHSPETISRKFTEVLESINRMVADILKPNDPEFKYVHPKLREDRFWPHFKDCIGAIDGSHIPVTVPLSEQPKYHGSV